MFKKIFGSKSSQTGRTSRQALILLEEEIAAARAKVASAEGRVARLRGIADEEVTSARSLQEAIARDEGVGLELYAAGHATPVAGLVTAADAAAKAATVARTGLPAAERDLTEASGTVAQLEGKKRGLVSAALTEHGNVLAAKYRAKFIELGVLYDELLAFAQGTGLAGHPDVTMVISHALEVPKFKLPAMHAPALPRTSAPFSRHGLASDTTVYTPYLRHEVDSRKVQATAAVWTRFANMLVSDPAASVTNMPAAAVDTIGPGRMLRHRERAEPSMIEAGLIPGAGNGRWLGI